MKSITLFCLVLLFFHNKDPEQKYIELFSAEFTVFSGLEGTMRSILCYQGPAI